MIGGIEHLVESGPLLLAMPVAAAAGAVTFLSPCCLPLVPGYLAYLTGMSGTAVQREDADGPACTASPAETSTAATVTSRTSTAGTASAGTASVSAVGTMPDRKSVV